MPVRTTPPSLRRLQDAYTDLVDHRVGVVQYVGEQPKEPGSPDFHRFVARASDTAAFCGQRNFDIASAAAGTREMALAKTLGEAVERYCAAIYDRQDFPLTSYRDAPFPCVHPDTLVSFHPSQYAWPGFLFRPFTEDAPVRWAATRDLASGDEVWIPACFLYVPYTFDRAAGEVPITQPISTGLACHCSWEEAAAGGLSEVVERDAFTLTWMARLSHPRIRLESLSADNRDLVGRLGEAGYQVTLVDASTDNGIPAMVAAMRNPAPGGLPVVFAASAALDPEEAARKCLEELAHTERYMWQIYQTVPEVPSRADHADVVDQVSHLRYWTVPSRLEQAGFIWASERWRDFGDIPSLATGNPRRDLDTLVERIAGTGCRPLVRELTTEDVAGVGLRVVSCAIPGYHPLHMGHSVRALGGRRLYEVPPRLGHPALAGPHDVNPYPHPFP